MANLTATSTSTMAKMILCFFFSLYFFIVAGINCTGEKGEGSEMFNRQERSRQINLFRRSSNVFLGVIHRLDRPVSGVVIFARTSKALIRMNKMMQEKVIAKKYIAIVSARPDELSGTLTHHISKDETKNTVRAYASKKPGTKEAVLNYQLKGELDGKILLDVEPLTGRPHQIRVQLSKINCPIVGDLKYGATYPLQDKSIALHCIQMSFLHPVGNEPVVIKAEPPRIFPWNTFSL